MSSRTKSDILSQPIKHVDIKKFNAVPLIDQFEDMSFQARNLSRACKIYDMMIRDVECISILTLAGSLISSGLKSALLELVNNNMVDAIVSTGANIVDMDFFEGLGFSHYKGTPFENDNDLMNLHIDRIYDTYIDEDQLRICDHTIAEIAEGMSPAPYSSREFINQMGAYLVKQNKGRDSLVRSCYEKQIPIFVPAFSDCSAGLGLCAYQHKHRGKPLVTIDSVKDFYELTRIKLAAKDSGLIMIAGGAPKNFAQDVTVAGDILGADVGLHKYAVQITVADERDGALSGSTLKEAHSWAKVSEEYEQMVFCEATIAVPLMASYVYHQGNWKKRKEKRFSEQLSQNKI